MKATHPTVSKSIINHIILVYNVIRKMILRLQNLIQIVTILAIHHAVLSHLGSSF